MEKISDGSLFSKNPVFILKKKFPPKTILRITRTAKAIINDLIIFSVTGKVLTHQVVALIEGLRTKAKYVESLPGQAKKRVDFSNCSVLIA